MVHITDEHYRKINKELHYQAESGDTAVESLIYIGDYLLVVKAQADSHTVEDYCRTDRGIQPLVSTEYRIGGITSECLDENDISVPSDFEANKLELEW